MKEYKVTTEEPATPAEPISHSELTAALQTVESFLSQRAVSDTERINFKGTAARAAKMYREMAWEPAEIAAEVADILTVSFPVDSTSEPGMIVQGPITLNSMCPHHLLPVRYAAYVAYMPTKGGNVLGLSKLARIPEFLSKRFVLQEQLAKDVADALYEPDKMVLFNRVNQPPPAFNFKSDGSIVSLIGVHTCEACRGVRQDARTMVTERRGAFQESSIEGRFLQAVEAIKSQKFF